MGTGVGDCCHLGRPNQRARVTLLYHLTRHGLDATLLLGSESQLPSLMEGVGMTQFASVRRFCAIEGAACDKAIPYKGPWTFFFAYPSTPHWQDFSSKLVGELGPRGFTGTRWEDIVKNDLIFSKVCDGIYGHDYLLAEVTEPNPNVLLEIGYALAVGRLPILLKDKNQKEWSRNLLTTLESCYYETREDIHSYIAILQSQPRTVPEHPDRRLPFLENMGIFDREETPGTVYHLKPKLSADWISRVDRTLRSTYFKTSTMDPSDSVYDEFYPQARAIQSNSLIVASFVSKTHNSWQQHNAHVALLVGFAIGLGKQVLILQQEPIAPILDLGSVSRPIETETQAEQIVKAWIDGQTRSVIGQTAESRRLATKRQEVDRIRSIYLGHPDALQDNQLLDCFVRTKEFEDALEGRRTIFIGRRGSGKSANFQAIKQELQQSSKTVLAEIAPDDFELQRISEFLKEEYPLTDPRLAYRNTWNYILLSEILKSLAERTERLYLSPGDIIRSSLHKYYEENRALLDLDFGARVISILRDLASSSTSTLESDSRSDADEPIKSLRNYQIGRRLKEFADREDIMFFVVADDLDKHWMPDTRQSIDLLIGLIAEVDRLQRFFGSRLKIVMFLKEDIYEVLSQYDDDLPKRSLLRMEWTQANLKHLVAERLAFGANQHNDDDDTTWSVVFPESVRGRPATEYILSRALPRPRDVLDLCQKSIDQAQRNGHSAVTEQDILDGEGSFSEGLFVSVCTEFRGLYPGLENILIEFAGVPERMAWDDFERIAIGAIRKNRRSIDPWARKVQARPEALADILFRVGVIGLSKEVTASPYFCNGRSFAETWVLVSPKPIVHVHAGFAKFLDVSEVGLSSIGRSRRARAVGPEQLPFRGLL